MRSKVEAQTRSRKLETNKASNYTHIQTYTPTHTHTARADVRVRRASASTGLQPRPVVASQASSRVYRMLFGCANNAYK